MSAQTLRHQLMAVLLSELDASGKPLGTDKYLQVQELLRQVPAELPTKQLRSLLAPLFSTSPKDQEAFYALFDQSWKFVKELNQQTAPDPVPYEEDRAFKKPVPPVPPKKINWRLIALSVLAVAAITVFVPWKKLFPTSQTGDVSSSRSRTERLSLAPGDTSRILLRLPGDTAQLRQATPTKWQSTPHAGRYQVNLSAEAAYAANAAAAVGSLDSMQITLQFGQRIDSIQLIAEIIAPEKPVAIDTNLIAELPLPFPQDTADFAQLRIDSNKQARYDWWKRYEWPLKGLVLLGLALLAYVILYLDQRRRAKAVAELQRPDRAPYLWNPDTGVNAADFLAADAQALLARLRGRNPNEEHLRLDLPATVRASTRAGGRIQLRYRRQTLPTEYLLLIDRLDAQDHRARLFDALYQVFWSAEVLVSRYYYDGDPRLCFNEAHPQGLPLSELQYRHPTAQLLLLGDGQGLLSAVKGTAAKWTTLLEQWSRRVLLHTRPLESWSKREKVLQDLLPVLPASPGGLSAAIDLFATENPAEVRPDLLERISDALQKHFAFEHELLPDLQRHFSEPLIDWIAACALWPTLHWDLTLHLGKIVGERSNQNLLDFSGIRELTRLPWFVEGRIPDAARIILVAYLQRRGLEIPLREAIRALLHHTQPPGTDTLAYDAYRMNVIVNELSLRPNAAKRRVLEREFERYLQAKKQIDVVAIKLLYRPITPLDVLLSERMKKYAFREGYRALGWRLAPQLLASWLLLGIGVAVFPLPQKPCDGKLVNYQNQSYCLSTPRDQLLHLEQLAADAIRAQQPLKVKSLVAAADLIKTQDTAFYENTAARYYNQGAQLYNCSRTPTAGCSPLPADSLRTLACGDFLRGDSLYTRLLGRPGPQFFAAQQRSCPQAINPNTGRPNTTQTPAAFDLRGTVLDALTQKPIAGALIQLAGLKTRSNGRGQYQFQLPSGAARTSLNLQASAKDYDPLQLRTAALPTLPKLRLTPSSSSLEAIAWEKALKVDRPEGYTIYLADFPTGAHAAEARQRISAATSVREQAAWGAAQKTDSSDGYTTYLADFPTGAHAAEARQRISAAASAREQAAWPTAQKTNTLAGYQAFLSAYPQGAYAAEAQNRLEQLRDDAAWEKAQTAQTPAACQQYLQQYPQGRHAAEARTCADPRPQTGTTDIPKPNLVRIPGGSFQMGDVMEDKESSDELPVHTVSLDAFELGRYEVTFAEYDRYCEATKKEKPADKGWGRGSHPIINVSWGDAIAYCNWLSTQHGYQQVYVTGKGTEVQVNAKANGYRLPSEAEWEYAARGRSKKVRFGNGKDIADPKEINFEGSKEYKKSYSVVGENRQQTVPVGSLNSPNALGLHDMSGNVYEWCWDWYGDTYYKSNPARNPQGPGTGSDRVLRGGSCYNYPQFARVALRGSLTPDSRYGSIGFRLARTP